MHRPIRARARTCGKMTKFKLWEAWEEADKVWDAHIEERLRYFTEHSFKFRPDIASPRNGTGLGDEIVCFHACGCDSERWAQVFQ